MGGKDSVMFSKNSDEWETPRWLFEKLDKEFHFDLDAACTPENCLGRNHYGYAKGDNALNAEWTKFMMDNGEDASTIFLNPPYSQIAAFIKKAYEESQKGSIVVCLIPSRTDTKYFHDYCMKAAEIRFIKGRLKFSDSKNSAPFPSRIIVFKPGVYTPVISSFFQS